MTKEKAEAKTQERLNLENPYAAAHTVPYFVFKHVYGKRWEGILNRTRYKSMSNFGIPILSPEEVKTLSEYLCLQHYYLSATDVV